MGKRAHDAERDPNHTTEIGGVVCATCEWCEIPATLRITVKGGSYVRFACNNVVHRAKTAKLVTIDHGADCKREVTVCPTGDAPPLIPPSRAAQLLAEAKARKPWPPETPCYKCGGPVGEPFSRLVTSRPVCVVCAWANIKAALAAHAADDGWLDKAIANATAAYDKDYPRTGIIPPLP